MESRAQILLRVIEEITLDAQSIKDNPHQQHIRKIYRLIHVERSATPVDARYST